MASEDLIVNTIRTLAADTVQKANSGHPGAPMGMAPLAHKLWSTYLRYNPANPKWPNRDRFVLSNGHACALQYVMLHLAGYEEYTLDELKRFRQLHSKTPGHPEVSMTRGGIEVTTGPLGQGISSAVGLAIAEAHLAATYNRPDFTIVDNYTYVFLGDGCMQEGVASEACSLAGHLGLHKLIAFYDDNKITIDGETELSFTEDVVKRYQSYGWHTIEVADGNTNYAAIDHAIQEARKITDRPTLIKVTTTIGFGSQKEGTEKVHGNPLGNDDLAFAKKKFGFNPEQTFHVPPEVTAHFQKKREEGAELEKHWNALFEKYSAAHPELAAEFSRRISGKLPEGWKSVLPTYKPEDPAKATRQFSQTVINALSKVLPELFGGSADLNPSTLSYMDISKDFQKKTPEGRNVRFGVREHGMAAILNGLFAYGGFIPYGATFLNFIGYAFGAVRLSAISEFGVLYVMTHDSIGLGEDGPTHQPIESLAMVRAMPHILLLRPADGNETSGAYAAAIENRHKPSVLCLSRQGLPNLKGTSIDGVSKGAYVIHEASEGKPQLIITGSGSEVQFAVAAAEKLHDVRVRVVSFPSFELFRAQSLEYKQSVFPEGVPVLAVEAASAFGWDEFSHAVVGMRSFGASAPLKDVLNHFGFTADNVAKKAKEVLEFYSNRPAHNLILRPF
jgi:transketolase